jgi:hypothetical protein
LEFGFGEKWNSKTENFCVSSRYSLQFQIWLRSNGNWKLDFGLFLTAGRVALAGGNAHQFDLFLFWKLEKIIYKKNRLAIYKKMSKQCAELPAGAEYPAVRIKTRKRD